MPENTEIPLTGDPRVDAALQRIRGKFRDLEDALLVQLYLEKDLTVQMKTLAAQMKGLAAHAARRDEEQERTQRRLDEMSEKTDERIAQLVSAIGKLIERTQHQAQ